MKKFLSILLALIFFFQCLPANVIAEAVNPVPTSMELSAEVAQAWGFQLLPKLVE